MEGDGGCYGREVCSENSEKNKEEDVAHGGWQWVLGDDERRRGDAEGPRRVACVNRKREREAQKAPRVEGGWEWKYSVWHAPLPCS